MKKVFYPPPGAASAQNIIFFQFSFCQIWLLRPQKPPKRGILGNALHILHHLWGQFTPEMGAEHAKVIWPKGGQILKIEKNFLIKSWPELTVVLHWVRGL